MKVKSESELAQLCLTLSDPMDYSPPGSSVHGIFQARVLEGGAIAFSAEVKLAKRMTPINLHAIYQSYVNHRDKNLAYIITLNLHTTLR